MNRFYIDIHHGFNQQGQPIKYSFVSQRLAGILGKNKGTSLLYFKIKPFTMFNKEYIATIISSTGVVILTKFNEKLYNHVERTQCQELMNLFVEKNVNLSFMDLIKFSTKHGFDLGIKLK